ncbi:PstS family phosphate ABC transporter substrate-binding protein [Pediococcus ethanolidurans]|uniref:Phosphate transport system substrate-binding protein n=2 Tax=Pediococcus ethanolidurans TaxID=319653 RepID=A0A1H9T3M7_9LACO|nr:substrate-binding domain-containing protein [Pediococcus ethanolidurans]MCV3322531.1 substrate-binding domain-containing protein [Pediococcus ethanolidurans]MCV3328428.1 substrate-binding domain-containing protein [Pediococcus ethanolidurans]SER91604.1 phosphate transport system substrate-binding protein [Pediococcus ethanolidurans]
MKRKINRTSLCWLLVRSLVIAPLIVGSVGVFGLGWWWAMIPALLLNGLNWYRYNKKYEVQIKLEIKALLIALGYYLGVFSVILFMFNFDYLKITDLYPLLLAMPYNLTSLFAGELALYNNFAWFFIGTFWSGILGIGCYKLSLKESFKLRKKYPMGLIVVLIISLVPVYQRVIRSQYYVNTYTSNSSELNLNQYRPFRESKKLVHLNKKSNFKITHHYPRLDGATAAYPIYSAMAQTLYSGLNAKQADKIIKVGTTPKAFNNLINKKADVIFMAAPSSDQIKLANRKHVKLKLTKIGSEAFVFLVNQKNPVTNLSVKQVQAIYQRKIISWWSIGGSPTLIQAFQRSKNSGSQTAMENLVMQGKKLATPMKYQEEDGMGGLIDDVAGYNNNTNAIGYSFRFYTTQMKQNRNVKLLKINGYAPTTQNIRNGKYPFIANVYAISRRDQTKNSQRIVKWLTSKDGQMLINKTGYVGLK